MNTTTPAPTGTLQDLFPHLKPAFGTARHARYGEVDLVKRHKNGRIGIRYLGRRQVRVFTTTADPSDLTDIAYR